MRFQIFFELEEGRVLPINYQYALSSWIYKVIDRADKDYADFLHKQGYGNFLKRNYKLFTFSRLNLPYKKWKLIGDRIKFYTNRDRVTLSCTFSFFIDKGAESFIMGLFNNQKLRLGDQLNQVGLSVQRVEARPITVPSNKVHIKAISPILISKPNLKENGKLGADYLNPAADPDYAHYFIKNLQTKYLSAMQAKGMPLKELDTSDWQFELLSEAKSNLITLKQHTAAQTRVKPYRYTFSLKAPIPVIEFGLHAGFGEETSQGLGCGELVD
ncbi:MAG: CRISPR-associated endoribonuclease Cas6 [Bacteroidota bacterium]